MLKKILVSFLLIISIAFINGNELFAGDETKEWKAQKECRNWKKWETMLHCSQFKIDVETFSPWTKETLKKAREGWWKTEETTIILLQVIIINMIIVFWVLSLFVMTIGWGFMIFHAWEESHLTKWKTMLKYWIISLVLALASWIMVKMVNWLLY